ncbi:MAG: hypothetical protein AB7V50_07250 [Vampirovibrionia bacterium]
MNINSFKTQFVPVKTLDVSPQADKKVLLNQLQQDTVSFKGHVECPFTPEEADRLLETHIHNAIKGCSFDKNDLELFEIRMKRIRPKLFNHKVIPEKPRKQIIELIKDMEGYQKARIQNMEDCLSHLRLNIAGLKKLVKID